MKSPYLDTPKAHDLSHKRDERCVPIAFQLVKAMAELEEMPTGSHINEKEVDLNKIYFPVVEKYLKTLIDTPEMTIRDNEYIFQLINQAFDYIMSAVRSTLENNTLNMVETITDINFNTLTEIEDLQISKLNRFAANSKEIKEVINNIYSDTKL